MCDPLCCAKNHSFRVRVFQNKYFKQEQTISHAKNLITHSRMVCAGWNIIYLIFIASAICIGLRLRNQKRPGGGTSWIYTAADCKRGVYVNIAWYIGYSLINTPFLFGQRFTRHPILAIHHRRSAFLSCLAHPKKSEEETNANLLFLRFYTTSRAQHHGRIFRQDCESVQRRCLKNNIYIT